MWHTDVLWCKTSHTCRKNNQNCTQRIAHTCTDDARKVNIACQECCIADLGAGTGTCPSALCFLAHILPLAFVFEITERLRGSKNWWTRSSDNETNFVIGWPSQKELKQIHDWFLSSTWTELEGCAFSEMQLTLLCSVAQSRLPKQPNRLPMLDRKQLQYFWLKEKNDCSIFDLTVNYIVLSSICKKKAWQIHSDWPICTLNSIHLQSLRKWSESTTFATSKCKKFL